MKKDLSSILNTLQLNPEVGSFAIGNQWAEFKNSDRVIHSPIDDQKIGSISYTTKEDLNTIVSASQEAFIIWQKTPAPLRGEIIRQIGDSLRTNKEALGALVTWEMGKSYQEGLGEVQEMIDICDFAVGLSRQLYGLTMHSERPDHRMYEQWHPLGIIGVISAFNFPVAVWSWNAMVAAVCGDVIIWKPSEKTPFTAIACQKIAGDVLAKNNLPAGIFNLVLGDHSIGQALTEDPRIPLVSATGSTRMGKKVASTVAARLGKSLLELGGNNALIITEHADIEMAIRATVFGAVGTCGQRCTSTRRLIVHASIYKQIKERLLSIYPSFSIGNPMDEKNLVGPLIDQESVLTFCKAVESVKSQGGNILYGGTVIEGKGNYVTPAIAEVNADLPIVQEETFGPLLYLIEYHGSVEDAIQIQNNVAQGLSSAVFTNDIRQSEAFLRHSGSDCGIANINIGTSGAEIGGAFGGEKETGGGRESGSDAWKSYMRRQTNTINYGDTLPLAQGINFDIKQ